MTCNRPRSSSAIDVRARAYYWTGLRRHSEQFRPEDSDIGAVAAGKIAVTPLHLNPHGTRRCCRKMRPSRWGEIVNGQS